MSRSLSRNTTTLDDADCGDTFFRCLSGSCVCREDTCACWSVAEDCSWEADEDGPGGNVCDDANFCVLDDGTGGFGGNGGEAGRGSNSDPVATLEL